MAMNGIQLGKEIAEAIGFKEEEALWEKIGKAIILHIQQNAVVNTTGSETTQTGTVS